jgi:hypothetical protein
MFNCFDFFKKSNIAAGVIHCQTKFKKMKICADSDGNVISEDDNESITSQYLGCEEHEISDDDLFQKCSVSTQTFTSVATVATQTSWTDCVNSVKLGSNINFVTEQNSDEMSFQTNISEIPCHTDSVNSFVFESDPTYVCDDELFEFLNKSEH